MLHYLLQVVLFQLCFLLVYELLLKRETFFQINRWYLIVMPVLGYLLPFLEFDGLRSLVPTQGLLLLPEVLIGPDTYSTTISTSNPAPKGTNWWLALYWIGFALSLLLLIRKSLLLQKLYKGGHIYKESSAQVIIVPQSRVACTFLGTIFLGAELDEQEKEQILNHELVHLRQRHSLDLLWYELLKVVFWFNPMIYLFQNRLSELHEFIADSHAVKSTGKRQYFEQLLNTAFQTKDISFINQFFNHSLIKKRILMLQKSNSRSLAKVKYLLILPLLFGMLVIVSCSSDNEMPIEPPVSETKSVEVEKTSSTNAVDGIPFSVIEDVPIYPGCEDLETNEERRACMAEKITQQVNKAFNTEVADGLDITGIQRIYVQFIITERGAVVINGARASHENLKNEAIRVIETLPNMEPGKHEGENIPVLYSLPIVFNAGE